MNLKTAVGKIMFKEISKPEKLATDYAARRSRNQKQ